MPSPGRLKLNFKKSPGIKPRNPTIVDPKKSNIPEEQDKDPKRAMVTMFKDHKEDVNKFLNEA